jgi:hypothetical protein
LVARGDVDPIALVRPFSPFIDYEVIGVRPPAWRGAAALDLPVKGSGSANFNYAGYLEVSRRSFDAAWAVLHEHPIVYLRAVATSWHVYLAAPSKYPGVVGNHAHIAAVDDVWRVGGYGELPAGLVVSNPWEIRFTNIGWSVVASTALVVFASGVALLRRPRRLARTLRAEPAGLFGLSVVLYVPLVANAVEIAENNRYRYEVEPVQIVLTVWLVVVMWRATHRRVSTSQNLECEK